MCTISSLLSIPGLHCTYEYARHVWVNVAAQLRLHSRQSCLKMALLECMYLEKWSSASSRQTFRSLRFVVWKTEREVKSWGRPMSRKGRKKRVSERERERGAITPLHCHNHSTLLISIASPSPRSLLRLNNLCLFCTHTGFLRNYQYTLTKFDKLFTFCRKYFINIIQWTRKQIFKDSVFFVYVAIGENTYIVC